MKRPNLKIIGIEEGEETQAKVTANIFNKTTKENFSNLKYKKHTEHEIDWTRKKVLWHIIIKILNLQNQESIKYTK